MHQNTVPLLLSLLGSVLQDRPLSDAETALFDERLLPELFALSHKHDLAHLPGQPLERAGLLPIENEYAARFRTAKKQAILRYEQANYALQQLCDVLEGAQIPFIPLKGAVIRPYYPQPWMRTGCDLDVLVCPDRLDDAVGALTDAGWQVHGEKGFHDISLFSPGGVHLELHFSIGENVSSWDAVLQTVWQHSAAQAEGRYLYLQSSAFLIFHLLAHMAYHFMSGGCGLRSFLDLELLMRRLPVDQDALLQLCEQAGLQMFYRRVMQLNAVWFGGQPHTPTTLQMEQFIVSGGVYGSRENRIVLSQAKDGGRARSLFKRVFLPYYKLKIQYPVLEKHRWLTPVFWVVRWFRMLFKGKFKQSVKELKLSQSRSDQQIDQTAEFLKNIGL